MDFLEIGIDQKLIDILKTENIVSPTKVQEEVIPKVFNNSDLIVQSQTGTGKTLAYLLPIFQRIDIEEKNPQCVIMVPTHELAMQIMRVAELLNKGMDIKIETASLIGGVNITRQIEKLKEKPRVIVGTPGRINELIEQKKLKMHKVKTIVLDEGDRLLDSQNTANVEAVIKSTLRDRQLLLFSASVTKAAIEKAQSIMKEPIVIKVEEELQVPQNITHLYYICDHREKFEALRKLVRAINPKAALVFINKSYEIELLAEKLKFHQLNAQCIHGVSLKENRKKAIEDIRKGKIQLLVSSDIASRGLDISGITHVFNMDMSDDAKSYLHRVGRTGRAGQKGTAISIVDENELINLQKICNKLQVLPKKIDIFRGKIFVEKTEE